MHPSRPKEFKGSLNTKRKESEVYYYDRKKKTADKYVCGRGLYYTMYRSAGYCSCGIKFRDHQEEKGKN